MLLCIYSRQFGANALTNTSFKTRHLACVHTTQVTLRVPVIKFCLAHFRNCHGSFTAYSLANRYSPHKTAPLSTANEHKPWISRWRHCSASRWQYWTSERCLRNSSKSFWYDFLRSCRRCISRYSPSSMMTSPFWLSIGPTPQHTQQVQYRILRQYFASKVKILRVHCLGVKEYRKVIPYLIFPSHPT